MPSLCNRNRARGLALCVSAIALFACASAEAAMAIAPASQLRSTMIQRIDHRCQPGFHAVNWPNGNGYRCVENGY